MNLLIIINMKIWIKYTPKEERESKLINFFILTDNLPL